MKFYSTNNKSLHVTLKEAVTQGLAPDNGLYMPERIPALPATFIQTLPERTFQEISLTVAKTFLENDIPDEVLKNIIRETIHFDAPLKEIEENVFALELFHGPTMAFKDFGARFMSQLLGHFAKQSEKEIVILVATSGDTGSAVANGFLGVKGTRVIVLYPSGKVSEIQEKQFTTLDNNITALEVNGTFDDCQRLVKQAFLDTTLRENYFLTSANSINIARLIPQSFYYFYAFSKLQRKNKPIVFSVPSGNFGNLTGALVAKRMGLPVDHFIVSTNANDVVPEYLKGNPFRPKPSVTTISNAMDVGNPSNFARIMDLYDGNFEAVSKDITGYAFTDQETSHAMQSVFKSNGYVLDPHGAVGYLGLKKYQTKKNANCQGIFLETAHPGKFRDVVEAVLQQPIVLPSALSAFMKGQKKSIATSSSFNDFKALLRQLL
jgi:threonine synthase